jgi:hypothetical protein
MKAFLAGLLLAVAAFLPTGALATYVFTTIDYPGAVYTDVRGINNTGRIVGYASLDGVNSFPFSYQGGVFAPLPATVFPVSGHGINDAGVIVGSTGTAGAVQGFLFSAGTYAFFSRPGWDSTYGRAIGPTGLVTGYSQDDTTGATAGYIYDPFSASYTDVTPAGSLFTIAQGINTAGQVVGSARMPGTGMNGFLRQPDGTFTLFQIGGVPTRARGINDAGLITGFMRVGGVDQGFVGNSSGFQTLMVPGSDATFPEAINNAGQVAGLYTTGGTIVFRGFLATPAAMPTGTTAAGAYTFSVVVIPNFPIFLDPPVAVGYDYAVGRGDPRFATVRLPIGIGDSRYVVKVKGRKFDLAGGELLDFRINGFAEGVDGFRVGCIEVDAMLDPADAEAFPTEVTFVAAGQFTGTMKPLARSSSARGEGGCRDDD